MENNTSQTKVFGAETSTPIQPNNDAPKADVPNNGLQETQTTKFFGVEPKQAEKKEEKAETKDEKVEPKQEVEEKSKPEVKEEVKKEEKPVTETKSEEDDSKKPLKVSFGENKEATPEKPQSESTKETLPINAEQVLEFLKTQNPNFKDLDTLSDLSKKETLPSSVEKFKKFVEETGRESVNDFYNVNKDWSKETPENRIREYLKFTEPNISDETIETQLELVNISDEEMEYLSDREQKQRKIEFDRLNNKALSYLQDKAKEYATPLDSKQVAQKPPTPEQIAEAYKPYWESRDKSLKELNEVKFNVDGIGEIKIPIDEKVKSIISKNTQTQEAFFERWQDDKGVIDTKKSNTDSMWAIPEIREQLISETLNQFQVLLLEAESKKRRNVQLDPVKKKQQEESTARLVKIGSNEQDSRIGKPLM